MDAPGFSEPSTDQSQFTLATLLGKLGKFGELPTDPELKFVELKEGSVLFEEGDPGDSMYIVVAGALGVRVKRPDGSEAIIDKLAPGATVGELALLSGQARSATVFAINDAGLIRLSQTKFEQLSQAEQNRLVDMESTVVARWQRLQLATVLHNLFEDLDANELHQLQNQMTWHHFSNGDILFRQGDDADGMYIVVNGRLRAVIESEKGDAEPVSEIVPGETVGEFGLITSEKRTATVYAVRETTVVQLTRPVFERLVRHRPAWMHRLTLILIKRRQRALTQTKKPVAASTNFAIVPASSHIDANRFAEELARALEKFGAIKILNSEQFDAEYGRKNASQASAQDPEYVAISSWIGELEADHAFVLYIAEAVPGPWSNRCINQADRVLILANPQMDPAPSPVEQYLNQLEVPLRTELVLWHPATTERPQGTIPWLQVRNVAHHHHIRQGDAAHMQRLARRLSGHAVGLVLSGGAALGFAHQGVYKAILDLDIPLDYVGGVSMGSIMGGAMATDLSYEEFENSSSRSGQMGVLDYTLPLAALTRSKNVMELLTEVYGPYEIEDLWIPYFCVSSNLTTAEPMVHRQGSMWRAIRASMSIPGVFLPVVENGEVLVDGGIMDNFPVATMAKLIESDHIIGVLISPFKERKRQYGYDTHLSGWRVLWHRLNPFSSKKVRFPSPADTLIWSMEINGRRMSRDQETQAELIIAPNVKKFNVTDYDKWRDLAAAGYEAALEPLRAWKAEKTFL